MITQKTNERQKAHRITFPIFLQYHGKTYKVKNWSTIGVAIEDSDDIDLTPGENFDAALVLPTQSASIFLGVTLKVEHRSNGIIGCSIQKIEENNRRVLRLYATRVIEGDVLPLPDFASDLFLPPIESPLKEPIQLREPERELLERKLSLRVAIYVVAIIALVLLIAYVALYNYTVLSNQTGVVAGNAQSIEAKEEGVISRLYIKRGDPVFTGMRLFDLNDSGIEGELRSITEIMHKLQRQLQQKKELIQTLSRNTKTVESPQNETIQLMARQLRQAASSLAKARALYDRRIISHQQFDAERQAYLRLSHQLKALQTNPVSTDPNRQLALGKLSSEYADLQKSITNYTLRKASLEQRQSNMHVTAQHNGYVFSRFAEVGMPVKIGTPIMLIQTDEPPYILAKINRKSAQNIQIGLSCIVRSATTGKHYSGRIDAMGYASIETPLQSSMEISYDEIPIRILLDEKPKALPLYSSVDVWILKPHNPLRDTFVKVLW